MLVTQRLINTSLQWQQPKTPFSAKKGRRTISAKSGVDGVRRTGLGPPTQTPDGLSLEKRPARRVSPHTPEGVAETERTVLKTARLSNALRARDAAKAAYEKAFAEKDRVSGPALTALNERIETLSAQVRTAEREILTVREAVLAAIAKARKAA